MKKVWWLSLCCVGAIWSWTVPSAKAGPTLSPKIKKMLAQGKKLMKHLDANQRKRGAYLLLQAYGAAPITFETLLAATRACNRIANDSSKKDAKAWGKKGWAYAKVLMKRWPKRAEGYFWASVNIGQYARGGGVWVALTQGLAGKIERMAKASVKRNPKLYDGAAQRVLGRYYFKVPWPMKKLNLSLRYLEFAYKLAPKDAAGIMFLAETLWAKGKRARAKKLFRQCAGMIKPGMERKAWPRRCKRWLQNH